MGKVRKQRDRYPCGRLRPAGIPGAPTVWRRIKDYGIRLGINPEVGSVLGRLSIFGELGERQVEAGRRFAHIVADFEREAGCPKRSPASPQYNVRFGRTHAYTEEMDPKAVARLSALQRQFYRLEAVLSDPHTRAIVEEVCCNDREIHSLDFPTLRSGLTALADYWKFPGKSNSARVAILATKPRRPRHAKSSS
jgi:hypothetical protein